MTIFNWVQKKLHQNVIKVREIDRNERKKKSEGISEIEKNTRAIMDQVGLVDALDNWFDGVLTIGTFGFDTLKFQQEDELRDCDECESVDLDFVVIDGNIIKNANQELDPLISNENKFYKHQDDLEIMDNDHIDLIEIVALPVVSTSIEEPEPQKKRTTLAELFMEDGDKDKWHGKKPKNHYLDEEVKIGKHNGSKQSGKFSFTKKKIIKSKSNCKDEVQDSRPIKKLNQMMKRMLKKKIHPDIDAAKALKKDVLYKPTEKHEAMEKSYLLKIQDQAA